MSRCDIKQIEDRLIGDGFSKKFIHSLGTSLRFGDGEHSYNLETIADGICVEVECQKLYIHIYSDTAKGDALVYDYSPNSDNRYLIEKIADEEFKRK